MSGIRGRHRLLSANLQTVQEVSPRRNSIINVITWVKKKMIDFQSRETDHGTLVIQASGKLDSDTNQYFFDCVKDEIERGKSKSVINLEGLGYISSLGLAALVRANSKVAKVGGEIYLACIESQILDIFRVVNFDKLFNFYHSEADAIAAIES